MSESYPALRAVLAEIQDRKGETLSEEFLASVVEATLCEMDWSRVRFEELTLDELREGLDFARAHGWPK